MSNIPPASAKFRFDMRSDILAPPSPSVQQAIIEAVGRAGEFDWRKDPIEEALEHRTRDILGKPAAALFPTCTAANIAALVALGARQRTLVMEEGCHLAFVERAGIDWLTQARYQTFDGGYGTFEVSRFPDLGDAILCLENTHNKQGGTVLTAADMDRIATGARSAGWSVFLDGSRLWNAAVAARETPASLAEGADVVSVSFNKGLAAPNGAALAGSEELVADAVAAWRALGGICRPSHILAAGALAALDEIDRLAEDHDLARQMAAEISRIAGLIVHEPQTNLVLVSASGLGLDGPALASCLTNAGLGCLAFGPNHVRLVVHRGIQAGSAAEIAWLFGRALAHHHAR